jgi:putative transposase
MTPKPHRKRVQHFEGKRHLHELTFSCYRRQPLLTNDRWQEILSIQLENACEAEGFGLVAFVFMPEHVHLLVQPLHLKSKIARLLARTKQPTSKLIKQLLLENNSQLLDSLTVRERPGKYCFRFWQAGAGFDRNLFSPQAIEASINYIHSNPVKRGLCQKDTDWKWSSARFHINNTNDPDLPTLIRPDPDWFGTSGIQKEFG